MLKMEKEFIEDLAKQWLEKWPSPVVCQKQIEKFTGGLMKKQTLVNLCNLGKGPEGKFYIRGQACWKTDTVVPWLLKSFTTDKRKKPGITA